MPLQLPLTESPRAAICHFVRWSFRNDLLSATVLLDKGADIDRLVYKPRDIDALSKTPWGLNRLGVATGDPLGLAWLEAYEGDWQEIFPNGVTAAFTTERTGISWGSIDDNVGGGCMEAAGSAPAVRLTTRLARSPFRIERIMRVEAGRPVLTLQERQTVGICGASEERGPLRRMLHFSEAIAERW